MSFPEELFRILVASECPALSSRCPYCQSTNVCRVSLAREIQSLPPGRINAKTKSLVFERCESIFYEIAEETYVSCCDLLHNSFARSYGPDFDCFDCKESFRLFHPTCPVPKPYISEFSRFPCMKVSLDKRNKRSRI